MFIPVVRYLTGIRMFSDLNRRKLNLLQRARWFGKNATELVNRAVYTSDIQATELVNKGVYTTNVPKRSLGGLEKYYYNWANIWDDAFGGYISLTSKHPIHIAKLADALSATVQQHPVLRASFQKADEQVELVTPKENTVNFEIVRREDFRLMFQSFSLENKVWRLILLNPDSDETNKLSFIFAVHHALSDFTYCRTIIRDMFNYLSILQYGGCIELAASTAFSEPIENLIHNVDRTGTSTNIIFPTTDWTKKRRVTAIDVCNRHFEATCRENTSKILRWSIDKNLSQAFQSAISSCHGSMNSALLAVFLSSFMELVQNSIHHSEIVELPYSVLVDLRRYIRNDQVYNGSACVDTEGSITLDSALKSKNIFWALALMISKKIRELIKSGEPLRYVYEEVDFQTHIKNNKREAILLTHVGHLDEFLGSGDHFKLVDFKVNMRTSSDLGPIFQVGTHFLREELCVTLGYNCALIPDTAAQEMAKIVNNVIKRVV